MQASDTVAVEVEVNGRKEAHTVAARIAAQHRRHPRTRPVAMPPVTRATRRRIPRGADGGAAAVVLLPAMGPRALPRAAALHKIGNPIDRRIIASVLRRQS